MKWLNLILLIAIVVFLTATASDWQEAIGVAVWSCVLGMSVVEVSTRRT